MRDEEAATPQDEESAATRDAPSPIPPISLCGVGASAGGLAPVEEFFDDMPADTGIAFVVVQHLSPDHESMMVPLLSSHTTMEVLQATDGMAIEANTIYLIPPGADLSVDRSRIRVHRRKAVRREPPRPIDEFFASMAKHHPTHCAAIILSGTGSDGTAGIEQVRRAGGLTLVQDESAAFEGMPTAALQSGFVDAVLPPADLARAVIEYATTGRRPGSEEGDAVLTEVENRILGYVGAASGIAFNEYKPNTIRRRIERRFLLSQLPSMDHYADRVRTDTLERSELVDDLLIDVTNFFRDTQAFDLLEQEVIPGLLQEAAEFGRPLRAWVAGCATGEEAYSLAMLLLEGASKFPDPPPIQIFATDVHSGAIETAGAGRYAPDRMTGVSAERLELWFDEVQGDYQVKPQLRAALTFARHNLLNDAPFTKVDLVTCRNMLIYFRNHAQDRALASMSFALRFGGVLFLGSSESLGFAAPDFASINSSWRMYRKEGDSARRSFRSNPPIPTAVQVPTRAPLPPDQQLLRSYDALLEAQFVAGLLVNTRRELVHVMGKATSWLRQPTGRPTLDLLAMVPEPETRLALSSALRELEAGAAESTPRPLSIPHVDDETPPTVLFGKRIESTGPTLFALYSRPAEEPVRLSVMAPMSKLSDVDTNQFAALEAELSYTRESLQSSLQEQETSNEELNAANEELIAANEELQSTNEELSSVNEELRTLNDEHQRRLDQVLELTADLEQLMSSTEIGVVFLAEDQTIRRFNEPARDYFRVRESDVGRPFEDVTSMLAHATLADDIATAFASGVGSVKTVSLERERGRKLVTRIARYELPRTRWGVFIAVVDITDIQVSDQERLLATLLQNAPVSVALWNASHEYIYANQVLDLDIDPLSVEGVPLTDVLPAHLATRVAEENARIIDTGEPIAKLEHSESSPGIYSTYVAQKFRVEIDAQPHVAGLALPTQAISEIVELEHSRNALRTLIDGDNPPIVGLFRVDGAGHEVTAVESFSVGTTEPALEVPGEILAAIEEVIEQGHPASLSTALDQPGRRRAWGRWEVIPSEEGERKAVVAVVDTTAEQQEIAALRNRLADVEAQLTGLREQAAIRTTELAQRNEDLDSFAHVAAHDLKAPIRSIRSFTELALDDLDEPTSVQAHLQQVVHAAQRMGMLIDSLLAYASIGRDAVELEQLHLSELVADVGIDLRPQIESLSAEVTVISDGPLMGNREGLQSIITNLVGNSLKYTTNKEPRIDLAISEDNDGTTLVVTDNGPGFDQKDADRMFEPFQRLQPTSSAGSGVGLAICKRIVQQHQGRIWASSQPGSGATFNVWLPGTDYAPDNG